MSHEKCLDCGHVHDDGRHPTEDHDLVSSGPPVVFGRCVECGSRELVEERCHHERRGPVKFNEFLQPYQECLDCHDREYADVATIKGKPGGS